MSDRLLALYSLFFVFFALSFLRFSELNVLDSPSPSEKVVRPMELDRFAQALSLKRRELLEKLGADVGVLQREFVAASVSNSLSTVQPGLDSLRKDIYAFFDDDETNSPHFPLPLLEESPQIITSEIINIASHSMLSSSYAREFIRSHLNSTLPSLSYDSNFALLDKLHESLQQAHAPLETHQTSFAAAMQEFSQTRQNIDLNMTNLRADYADYLNRYEKTALQNFLSSELREYASAKNLEKLSAQENRIQHGVEESWYEDQADQVGLIDYALTSSVSVDADTPDLDEFTSGGLVSDVWKMINKYKRLAGDKIVSPSAARAKKLIDPNNYPGQCWPFKGSSASIRFALLKPIAVSHITVDHSHPALRLCNDTAPRAFQVTGLTVANVDVKLFSGTFDFRKRFQTFDINNLKKEQFLAIQLQIISNYGGAFTCVYRIRIHAV